MRLNLLRGQEKMIHKSEPWGRNTTWLLQICLEIRVLWLCSAHTGVCSLSYPSFHTPSGAQQLMGNTVANCSRLCDDCWQPLSESESFLGNFFFSRWETPDDGLLSAAFFLDAFMEWGKGAWVRGCLSKACAWKLKIGGSLQVLLFK